MCDGVDFFEVSASLLDRQVRKQCVCVWCVCVCVCMCMYVCVCVCIFVFCISTFEPADRFTRI